VIDDYDAMSGRWP